MRIDSHQHFWMYEKQQHAWINDAMHIIQKNFMPADLQPVLKKNNIDGCVLVQVDQTEDENIFQLKNDRDRCLLYQDCCRVHLTKQLQHRKK